MAYERDSEVVGQLGPGQLVTVVEERIDNNTGDVRAKVTIEDHLLPHGFETARGEPSRWHDVGSARGSALTEVGVSSLPSSEGEGRPGSSRGSPRTARSSRAESCRSAPFSGNAHGWVTLVKDGRKLVTSRVRLHAGQRRQHMNQWSRRLLNDKTSRDVQLELATDPTGIGEG